MNGGCREPTRDLLGKVPESNRRVARWTVMILLAAIDRRDARTGEHARAVARLSGLVGLEMGLPAYEMRTLLVGALLHDLGRFSCPTPYLRSRVP